MAEFAAMFRDLHEINTWHARLSKRRIWQRIFQTLVADPDDAYAMIDSTIVHTHQSSGGAKKGPNARQSGMTAAG